MYLELITDEKKWLQIIHTIADNGEILYTLSPNLVKFMRPFLCIQYPPSLQKIPLAVGFTFFHFTFIHWTIYVTIFLFNVGVHEKSKLDYKYNE